MQTGSVVQVLAAALVPAALPCTTANRACSCTCAGHPGLTSPDTPPQTLYVDCANGVGAPKLAALAGQLAPAGLTLELRNTGDGVLNGGCGSDFLQKDRQLPSQFEGVAPGARCCAVDGDADRLMYFTPLEGGGKGEGGGWTSGPGVLLFAGEECGSKSRQWCRPCLLPAFNSVGLLLST